MKIWHLSGRICLHVYMYLKLSGHSVCLERLTQVYKGTSSRGRGYIDLNQGYMGWLKFFELL